MNYRSPYASLIGRTVAEVVISKDRTLLTFITTTGSVSYRTEGDCCSDTWIESLDNPEALLGTVVSVEDIEMPNLGNVSTEHREYVEYVAYYGIRFITDKGICVLDYRNDSNGYYGGNIVEYED